ncbi:MAG: hypothetical protein HY762_01155 [Planctomycetes bacterium]|nr:hypothetical protein [Planctomycetota bacterium]
MDNKQRIKLVALIFVLLAGWVFAEEETITPSATASEEHLLKDIPEIKKEVERIRGKKFKSDVPAKIQSEDDFRKFLKTQIDEELPPAKAHLVEISLIKLGLLPEGYDIRKGLEDIYASQAGAYYEPKTKTIYLLKTDGVTKSDIKTYLAHELCHALQDQYFDLDKLYKDSIEDDDRAMALKYLTEGEATYLMLIYSLKHETRMEITPNSQVLQLAIGQFKHMDGEQLTKLLTLGASFAQEDSAEANRMLESLKDMPPYLLLSLVAPYFHGLGSIAGIISIKNDDNAWQAVDTVYKNPPRTTEQIIHPEKMLSEKDEPAPIGKPGLPGDTEIIADGVLGEFGFWSLYDIFETKAPRKSSEGWDGDRYYILKHKETGHIGLYLATAWDSDEDALESFKAYQKVLRKKYPGWEKDKTAVSPDTKCRDTGDNNIIKWYSPDGQYQIVLSIKENRWDVWEDIPK